MKKQIFTIFCFLFLQETINAQFTLEALNPSQLRLKTNGIDRMAITNGGNFAFGHTSPAGQFHFQRNSAGVLPGFGVFNTVGIFENSTDALMYIITPTTATGSLNFGDTDDVTEGRIQYNHSIDEMSFSTNSAKRLFIKSDGKVSIGIDNPDFNFEVKSSSDAGLGVTRFGGDSPGIIGRGAGGTEAAPTATQNNHILSIFGARGHTGLTFTPDRAKIEIQATQNWSSSNNGTNMNFFTTENGTNLPVSRVFIGNGGQVGIGTTAPQAKLDVDGDIRIRIHTLTSTGTYNSVNRNGASALYFSVAGNATLNGIAGGKDGMIVYVMTATGTTLTINNESTSANAEDRIATHNGVFTIQGRGGAMLIYEGGTNLWRLMAGAY
jgi:hypothetical protein